MGLLASRLSTRTGQVSPGLLPEVRPVLDLKFAFEQKNIFPHISLMALYSLS